MTKKHIVQIAEAIRATRPEQDLPFISDQDYRLMLAQWKLTSYAVAGALQNLNPNFDWQKFETHIQS